MLSALLPAVKLEDEQIEKDAVYRGEEHYQPAGGVGPRSKADQHQNRRAEDDAEAAAGNQVVGSGRAQVRVDLAQQQHAGADGAGEHAVHGNEALVIVAAVNLFADDGQVDPGDDRAGDDQQDEREPQPADVLEVDGGDARDDHDIEEEPGCSGTGA